MNESQKNILHDYLELAKPRIVTLVLVTTSLGYFLGVNGFHRATTWILTLAGMALTAGGASVLNHLIERDTDKLMDRTKNRPLPTGRVKPQNALFMAIFMVLAGGLILILFVNMLTAYLALQGAFLYAIVYTPLKRISWINTPVGAIPGALPPLIGWTAATGRADLGGWLLFLLLFVWQHPHFYSIAWLWRHDYARGGLKMLPVIDPSGRRMFRQTILYAIALIPVSLLPVYISISGIPYAIGAVLLGIFFLKASIHMAWEKDDLSARSLLKASVIYLPALFALIMADNLFYSIFSEYLG